MMIKIKSILLLFMVSFASIIQAQVISHHNYCSAFKSTTPFRSASASPSSNALMQQYDVKFYFLDLTVQRDTNRVEGNVRTLAKVVSPSLDTFVFELHTNHTIDSVVIAGMNLPFFRRGNDVYVPFPSPMMMGDMIDASIYYKGTTPADGSAAIGNGFSNARSMSWGNQVTWSLSQPFAAYEWFPCKQDLMDKVDSSYCYITTDTPNLAGSNGVLKQVVNVPGGKRRFEWVNIHPIDYYLISVACAKYIDYSVYAHPVGSVDSVLMQNYIYDNPGTLPAFKDLIDQTALGIDFFSTILGPYPFEKQKYGHCMAPFSGGMEHQTMTSQGFFDFTVDLHELCHQWFGDNVTCQTWRDIWVNEGFASYGEYLAVAHFYPGTEMDYMQSVHDNVMSQPDGSVWFNDSTNVVRIFDGRLTYDKGSAIIHTIRFLINNDSLFFMGLRNYQNTYKNSTATAVDLKNVMQSTGSVDLTDWINEWFYGEGYPNFDVKWNQVADKVYLHITHTTSTATTTLFKTPLELRLNAAGSDTVIRVNINSNDDNFVVQWKSESIDSIEVDPNNWILNLAQVSKDESLLIDNSIHLSLPKVYPTLVKDFLFIEGNNSSLYSAEIIDMNGKILFTGKFAGNTKIDMQKIPAGAYTVLLKNADGKSIHTVKVIKD